MDELSDAQEVVCGAEHVCCDHIIPSLALEASSGDAGGAAIDVFWSKRYR